MPRPVLLIAGGSRGIGASTARLAAARGYDVAINYVQQRQSGGRCRRCGEKRRRQSRHARRATWRKRTTSCASSMRRRRRSARSPISCTAPASAARIPGSMSRAAATIREVIDVNLFGALHLRARSRAPHVDRAWRQGRLDRAVVVDRCGHRRRHRICVLCRRQRRRRRATNGLAREVAKEGIRVNAIRPGPTEPKSTSPDGSRASRRFCRWDVPGEPEEIAEAVLFLLSDAASYISGAVLNVSGAR